MCIPQLIDETRENNCYNYRSIPRYRRRERNWKESPKRFGEGYPAEIEVNRINQGQLRGFSIAQLFDQSFKAFVKTDLDQILKRETKRIRKIKYQVQLTLNHKRTDLEAI